LGPALALGAKLNARPAKHNHPKEVSRDHNRFARAIGQKERHLADRVVRSIADNEVDLPHVSAWVCHVLNPSPFSVSRIPPKIPRTRDNRT